MMKAVVINIPERTLLNIVGTDALGVEGLSLHWQEQLRRADLLIAPGRMLDDLKNWLGRPSEIPPTVSDSQIRTPRLLCSDQPAEIMTILQAEIAGEQKVILLASGDPLWFGIGRVLLQHFPPELLRFHPAPSAMQLAFARIGRPWQDASWVSLHGRDPEPLAARLQQRPPALAVLCDPGSGNAATVREILRASGLEASYTFWYCERLGGHRERVLRLEPADPLPLDPDPLHLVVLIARLPPAPDPASLPLFGLPDGVWLHHPDQPGLMTKREVRVQVLADLELPERGVLWDIGAGVGSIGLEALRLRPALSLWAVERRLGAAALIQANARRLGVKPEGVLEVEAMGAMAGLPDPDRVVLGGGGRDRARLLAVVLKRLRPAGVVVIPLATLEALAELRPLLEAAGLGIRISQHQHWRGAPLANGTRLTPLNPVLVLSGGGAGG